MHSLLALTAGAGSMSWIMLVVWVVVLVGMMYFLSIRPQRKEQQKHDQLMASLEIGDSVCTTAGFYG
ncbi:MAG: preprotein translocase subunit YajC, partial [Lachnospiraceae bacterium]